MRLPLALVLGLAGAAACGDGPRLGSTRTIVDRGAANATVAVDRHSGAVLIAYTWRGADSVWTVQVARVDSTGRLLAPVRVDDGQEEVMVATQNPPEVVGAPDGNIYVAWVSGRRGAAVRDDISVHLARSTDGGATFAPAGSLPGLPPPASRANLYADLAVAPDGALYLSWLDLHFYTDTLAARARDHVPDSTPVPEDRVEFRVARSSDHGRSFEMAPALDTTACICCRSAVTATGDGRVYALWRHVFPGSVRDFQLAASGDGGRSFGGAVRVHDDHWVLNGCPDIGPDLVVDERGAVHVAWYTGAPGRVGLWYASSRDGGGSFSEPERLLGKGHASPSQVRLAVGGPVVYGAWEDRRGSRPRVVYGTPAKGNGTVLGEGTFPWIAAGGHRLAVTWLEGEAVRLRIGALPATP